MSALPNVYPVLLDLFLPGGLFLFVRHVLLEELGTMVESLLFVQPVKLQMLIQVRA
jgi:hypothetical protein